MKSVKKIKRKNLTTMSKIQTVEKVFAEQKARMISTQTEVLASETWNFLCDKNTVIACGFVYGMTWFGWKRTLKRPISSLILGSLICAPIAALGAEILCEILPPKTVGIVPVLFAGSFLYNIVASDDE